MRRVKWVISVVLIGVLIVNMVPVQFRAAAAHSHSGACYTGTLHTCSNSCYRTDYCSGRMTLFITSSVENVYCGYYAQHSGSYTRYETPSDSSTTCGHCGGKYNMQQYSTWISDYCSVCDKEVRRYHYATCPHCWNVYESPHNWERPCTKISCTGCGKSGTVEYDSHYKQQTVRYYACSTCGGGYSSSYNSRCTESWSTKICGKTNGAYYESDGTRCSPVCSDVVVKLEATKPVQTIVAGQDPDFTAKVTYLDGSTDIVQCSYSGYDAGDYDAEQVVVLSYGLYNGTAKRPGKATATTTVRVYGEFELAIATNNSELGHVTGDSGTILTGTECCVVAVKEGQHHFVGWYEGDVCVSTSMEYRFEMPARDLSLIAKFIVAPALLEVVPSTDVVYNGYEPEYDVAVEYSDGRRTQLNSEQYVKSGFTRGAGIKVVTVSYTEDGVTVSAVVSITVLRNIVTCRNGHEYELNDFDVDYGCPVCAETLMDISVSPTEQFVSPGDNPTFLVVGTYMDGHTGAITGWESDFDPSTSGVQYVTISYAGFQKLVVVRVVQVFTCPVCLYEYEATEDFLDPGCPECRRTCVALRVTPDTQIVEQGLPMDVVVTATFRDGHEAVVLDWTSNYQPFVIGKQQVTILYGGQGVTTEVDVVAKKTNCINCGRVYDPAVGGCPVCGDVLGGVRATTKGGTNTVVRGIRPSWDVYALYLDGHEEPVDGGYNIYGLDVYRLGIQNVTVTYEGFSCVILVEVVDGVGKSVCVNGHVYDLGSDGSDPGCPYCTVDADDKPKRFYSVTYNEGVVDRLYRDGVYYLQSGDSVTIAVSKKKKTKFTGVLDWFFKAFRRDEVIECGGIVE